MNLKMFSSLGLGVLLSLVSFSSVKAQTQDTPSASTSENSSELIISQLRGHNTHMGEPQIEWEEYLLGRVVGKSGGIIFILLEDGTSFTASGSVAPSSNVLVVKNANGRYSFVQASEAEWISILKSKYGYKRLDGSYAALNQRTAALWKELEMSSSRTVSVPPRQSATVQTQTNIQQREVVEYQETPKPIRGLW